MSKRLLFLAFSVLVANPKKLLYTVVNPARGLLNREKRTKEQVWQRTPPPPTPHTARSEKDKKIKITRRIYRRYAGLGRSRVRTRISSARRLGQWGAKFYTPVCDNKLPSLVASLFSWRYLAASTSSFLHAAMNIRPASVPISSQPTPQPLAPSLSSPPLRQTPGCRSGRNRSTLSPSHPVLSVLHPQGFRKRFASAAARRSFGGASPPTK